MANIDINNWYWVVQYIIPAILFTSLIWGILLVYKIIQLQHVRLVLRKSSDVTELHDAIVARSKAKAGVEAKNTEDPSKQAYGKFCERVGVQRHSPIALHIKAIYQAGLIEGRLDLAELNKHTEHKLFSMNMLLKGISSIFIILGLFGTLFGLSESFFRIQPALAKLKESQNTKEIANAIDALFSKLGNAFTPSIIGVFVTIASVLIFSLYLKMVCTPVKNSLNHHTINYWIPQLYPTTTQNMTETLKSSEKQMLKNFEAAQKVAVFAENVQSQFDDFGHKISNVNTVLEGMANVLEGLGNISDRFGEGVEALASQQGQLLSYFTQTNENFKKLESYIDISIKNINSFQDKIDNSYEEHNQKMAKVIDSFEYLKQLNEVNVTLAAAAENSFVEIGKSNAEIIEALKHPLVSSLDENFSMVTRTFSKELEKIVNMFNRMEVPMKESAESINVVFGNLSRSYDNLSRLIGENIVENNNKMLTEFLTENKMLVKYVANLADTTKAVVGLLEEHDLIEKLAEYKKEHTEKKDGFLKRIYANWRQKKVSKRIEQR